MFSVFHLKNIEIERMERNHKSFSYFFPTISLIRTKSSRSCYTKKTIFSFETSLFLHARSMYAYKYLDMFYTITKFLQKKHVRNTI